MSRFRICWMDLHVLTFALVISLCSAGAAMCAVIPVTPTTYAAAFATLPAAGGDTLSLAPGSYGFGDFSRKFTSPVMVTAADPTKAPSFSGLAVSGGSNITLRGLAVDWKPNASTLTWSWATRIQDSDHITFSGLKVIGGLAVAGLNEDGTGTDVVTGPFGSTNSGNIIGRPTGYGILLQNVSDTLIDGGEVASFYKAVFLNGVRTTTIRGLDVHDNRTTAIVGANVSDVTIDGNWLHAAHPWRWGNGDHADLLALWSNYNQTTPNARVRIVNNRMEQLAGEAILGMWFQGEIAAPFTDFEISGNQITVNNLQGILLSNSGPGKIANNVLRRATADGDPVQAPTILLRNGVTGIATTNNSLAAPLSDLSGGANTASGNIVVQGPANVAQPPAPTPMPSPPAVDPRDAQIAALKAQVASLTASLKVANDNLTTANAKVASLQVVATTAQNDIASDRTALVAIRATVAAALASNPTGSPPN